MLRNIFKFSLRCQHPGALISSRLSSGSQSGNPPLDNNAHVPIIDYDGPIKVPLPVYKKKVNEPLHQKKQRLIYQSRKRGMLENDLLLSTFAAKHLNKMSPEQLEMYDDLINGVTNDWDIYYWVTNTKTTPPEYDNEVMKMLKEHVANKEGVPRIRQPDLNT